MTGTISGTNGNDTLYGTSGNDTILGKAGSDVITAGSGNDKVDGGSGNDTIDAGSGNDQVEGGSGDDTIDGGAGNDRLEGEDGNDTIDGGSGNDRIDGDDGNDVLEGGSGHDLISGGDDDDTITGGTGNDVIHGGDGTDTAVFAGNYATYDILNLHGLVLIQGQDGTDLVLEVEYLEFDDGSYNVGTGSFTPTPPPALPLVSVVATDGTGTETAGDSPDFTFTFSRTGSTASALTVTYTIQPAPTDGATPGADFPAQTGMITFAAGSATATLSFDAILDTELENTEFFSVVVGAGAGYQVDTPNATANASIADGSIVGTAAGETLTGTNDPDVIFGLGGDDGLIGLMGADYLDGGAGFDRAIYTNAGAAVNIQLAAGTATIGAVVDTLRSIEFARGTAFADTYNATGFGPASMPNGSSEGNNFNGFEGLGGNDQIIGNGNTRIEFTNATAGVTVTFNSIVPGPGGGGGGSATGDLSVGTDTFSGVSAVRGSQHDDLIINFGLGNNTFDGQGGFDTVSYANTGGPINANLATGLVTGSGWTDTLKDNLGNITIESIIGTGANDTFTASGSNRFDGGFGADTLSMNNAINNVVTAISIETITGGAGDDTVTFVLNDGTVNQSISGGGGNNTLNLDGTSTNYSLTLTNFAQVNGHGGIANDNLNVLNQVAGTTFDFGAGNADELHVAGSTGINVFTVNNIENVFGALSTGDQIHIGGNAGGVTTVTAGLGPDQIWASTDTDHIHFNTTGDSTFDVPGGGMRDVVTGFNADQDKFDLSDVPGLDGDFQWALIDFGGSDIILIDIDGGGTDDADNDTVTGDYAGWEMAIGVDGLTGTLDNTDFLLA